MLLNYLKVAWRTLRKNKVSTIINVGGLAVGMASCLWLLLFVEHEWAYDRFHEDVDRLYRVTQTTENPDASERLSANTAPRLGPALFENFPAVDASIRLIRRSVDLIHEGESVRRSVLFADPGFFEVFTFPLHAGAPSSVLEGSDRIVLTQRKAQRFFGRTDVIGETLTIGFQDETREVTVTGIAENPPETSSIPFSFVMPLENASLAFPEWIREKAFESWESPYAQTYVRLAPAGSADELESKLPSFVEARYGEEADRTSLALQPIVDIHLSPEVGGGLAPTSDPRYAYLLSGIAFLVLLMACINFVTLALSRSSRRAREVGVRKALGATRKQLGVQFWTEAILTSALALLVGLVLARGFLPVFSKLTNVPLEASATGQPLLWLGLGVLVLGVGFLAGSYPAWVLVRLDAVSTLRGRQATDQRGRFSKALLVVQFTFAVGLVTTVFTMSQQIRYLSEKDLGFTEDPVVVVDLSDVDANGPGRFSVFQNAMSTTPSVRSMSNTMTDPLGGLEVALKRPDGGLQSAVLNLTDRSFLQTFELDIVEGRGLSEIESNRTVVVNEAFLRALGWENAVGRSVPVANESSFKGPLENAEIGGVVADYHFESLHEAIEPLILAPLGVHSQGASYASLRLGPKNVEDGMDTIREAWSRIAPSAELDYSFVHDDFAEEYRAEQRWQFLVGYAALFALLIACFGVFGLAALEVSRRKSEVGIRKVLGASATSIVALFSKDVVLLVLLGAVFGLPMAYYAAGRWLENFAYRIELGPLLFASAGLAVLGVALITVSYQALRAAWMDPATTIRQE